MAFPIRLLLPALLVLTSAAVHAAGLHVSPLFGDNMVLQRDQPVAVWGEADADATVTVSVAGKSAAAQADHNGEWKATLPPLPTATDATLTIRSGAEAVTVRNVAIGDVYFAGGQSNMQFKLQELPNGHDVIAAAHNANVRMFTVAHAVSFRPQHGFIAPLAPEPQSDRWLEADPQNAGQFSAIAYFFAQKLQHDERVPIGIIHASWGGTPIQAHMSLTANGELPFHRVRAAEIAALPAGEEYRFDPSKATPVEPASIFNAMIDPVIPYTIVGCLWYQGEQNWNYPYRYRRQLVTFINDLRIRWGLGYLPFFVVQLPNMGKVPQEPGVDFWSVLRESQMAALDLPNTRVMVTLDLGDGDLHAKNKQPFGERLAALAEKDIYHRPNLVVEGPRFLSVERHGDTLELTFATNDDGLAFRGGEAKGFAIAGEDRVFHWATARIEGHKVIVSSPDVKQPEAVRYGWGENPRATLINEAGLPAYPFRTDDWPVTPDGSWGTGGS